MGYSWNAIHNSFIRVILFTETIEKASLSLVRIRNLYKAGKPYLDSSSPGGKGHRGRIPKKHQDFEDDSDDQEIGEQQPPSKKSKKDFAAVPKAPDVLNMRGSSLPQTQEEVPSPSSPSILALEDEIESISTGRKDGIN